MILGATLMGVAGLASLACWIIVLVKMFKTQESPLMGILGIVCSIWAYIWGWINAGKYGLTKVMIAWTACIIVSGAGYSLFAKAAIEAAQAQGINFNPSGMQVTPATAPPADSTGGAE